MVEPVIKGVNGLRPDFLNPWREDLATFNRLMERETLGETQSSHPPQTAPAWTTLFSGKQGGKHGVFGFKKRVGGSYGRKPVNYSDLKVESLSKSAADVACGVVNLALSTHPTELDDGFVVSRWPVSNRVLVCNNENQPDDVRDHLKTLGYLE